MRGVVDLEAFVYLRRTIPIGKERHDKTGAFGRRYCLFIARSPAQALADVLPEKNAHALYEFFTRPLLVNPQHIGKPLQPPLVPAFSAHRDDYRILYFNEDATNTVKAVAISDDSSDATCDQVDFVDDELHKQNRTGACAIRPGASSASKWALRCLSFSPKVALSTADTSKWLLLIEARLEGQTPDNHTSSDYQLLGPIRQQQRRLTQAPMVEMASRYEGGATVCELAAEFGCHRTTVAARLKNAGIAMRCQSPTSETIASMVGLYASGLSHLEVGEQLGYCANTVRSCLQKRQVQSRDVDGRERKSITP